MSDDIFPEMPEKKHIDGKNLRLEQQLAEAQAEIIRLKKAWNTSTLQALENGQACSEAKSKIQELEHWNRECQSYSGLQATTIKNQKETIKELSEALLEAADDISAEYGYQHADKYRDLVEKAK